MKLDIGGGPHTKPGWTCIDRREGKEAYPLPYADDSVDEVRASHVLEHFSFEENLPVLREWVRVLKPGGRIRIAVPDVDRIFALNGDARKFAYLMGGQQDANDYHKSAFDRTRLEACLHEVGVDDVQEWESDWGDCAEVHKHISLNLEGVKKYANGRENLAEVKIGACMSVPRYGAMQSRGVIEAAIRPFNLPLATNSGVFWGQCMQRHFNKMLADQADWILTLDYDSMLTSEHLSQLMKTLATNPEIDALAALQCRREGDKPLMTQGQNMEVQTDGSPIKVTSAHFGCTLIRTDALKDVPKPWFKGEPGPDGEWDDDRLDDDIWFWHRWREAGKTIYVDPTVRIGHLEECVSYYDHEMAPQRTTITKWRREHGQ